MTAAIQGVCEPRFAPLRASFEHNFTRGRELGASLCVYQHGRLVVDLWGGLADQLTRAPWRRDTITLLASTTKAMAASAAMLLVDRGVVDLDAPVAGYWPEFAAEGKAGIPLRWLLGHRSGVVTFEPPLTLDDVEAGTLVAEALGAARPEWRPGHGHGYHSLTMGWLVSEVIRRTTGLSVGRFFATEIAAPLGLDLHIGLPAGKDAQLAAVVPPTGQQLQGGRGNPQLRELSQAMCDPTSLFYRSTYGSLVVTPEMLHGPRAYRAEIPSCGGVGNAAGLARLHAALIGEVDGIRLLRPETTELARTVEAQGRDLVLHCHTRYGRGFMLPGGPMWPEFGAPAAFGHAGATGAFAFADPDSGLAFGYVPNRMSELIEGGDDRVWPLIRTACRCAHA
ncbi:serine hydrolase domain-containing protein [Streptosporangium sp. KLBMP 9127]|nr:beta-lactamase family protein [Streptosporangium sp. KLBMP 9127]